jgi:TRAP-type C4-dicarboxylate transport system permease large subunit
VAEQILGTGLPPYGVLALMMAILIVLGMFIDWVGILLLTVPIFVPILKSLPFEGIWNLPGVAPSDIPLWYGVIYTQIAFLSPPFGYSLFYLKSVSPRRCRWLRSSGVRFLSWDCSSWASLSASFFPESCYGCRSCFMQRVASVRSANVGSVKGYALA